MNSTGNTLPRLSSNNQKKRRAFAGMACAASMVLASAASAQTLSKSLSTVSITPYDPPDLAYVAKFTCGTVPILGTHSAPTIAHGQIGGGVSPEFQPGGYSSVLNVMNASFFERRVASVRASVPGMTTSTHIKNLELDPFETGKVNCADILAKLGSVSGVLEGYLYFTAYVDAFEVQSIYTYSAIDEFQEHVYLWAGINGQIKRAGEGQRVGGENLVVIPSAGAGAGSGGLGIGASIDVQRIEPRIIDPELL